ncbi:hypothetical protein [Paraflavitalea speifideaquila]|uniref:hypothetical protein n=1 Tax=Paraflavitalea speifideaquila TaxID=3076558 RepID=UPI0028E2A7B8|nr:hypothetical protein [Paraflavitalea speifideiaquila]
MSKFRSEFGRRWDERQMFWDEQHIPLESTWKFGTEWSETWDERGVYWDERHKNIGFFSVSPHCLLFASSGSPLWVLGARGSNEVEKRYHHTPSFNNIRSS